MSKQMKVMAFLWAVIASLAAGAVFAQTGAEKPASRLRAMYFSNDFDGGSAEGRRLTAQLPKDAELIAWHLLNLAASGLEKEAIGAAEKLIAADSTNAWAWFALAGAMNFHHERGGEALTASEKALARSPDHPDFIWLRADTLRRQDRLEEAIAFIDKHLANLQDPAELLVTKASALRALASAGKPDEAKVAAALATYAEARKIDPKNVNAHYLPGAYLSDVKRASEGYPLLRTAVALSPNAARIHSAYWRSISSLTDLPPEKKQAEIEADINALLERRANSPETLLVIAHQYIALKRPGKQKEIEDRILAQHPTSRAAEWVLVERYRMFAEEVGEQGMSDPKQKAAYRSMLKDFLNRPHHHQEALKGDAYRSLFYSIKDDPSVSDAELFAAVNGMKYDRINPQIAYAAGAIALAERKAYLKEAESLARTGLVEGRKKIEGQRRFYATEGDYERRQGLMTGIMRDALGWVLFHAGRLDEAEREMLQAYELNPENLTALYHLGRLYESKGEAGRAEEFYIKGAMTQTPGVNPNVKALQALYEKRHGKLEGYNEYMAKIAEIDRAKRKEKILAARLAEPKPVAVFKLKALDSSEVSLESLRGKIAVINFWGVWCGWCVKEMPDFQKLYEKYRNDPEVIILTIDNDPDVYTVRQYMQKNRYQFGVLLDDGYVNDAGVRAFPTTWFLDRQGRLAFVKQGWSEKLLEEFSWRVEELKKPAAQSATSR